MKILLTLALALSLSQAYGQSMGAQGTAPATNSRMPGTINSPNNNNKPNFGNKVPDSGTTTGTQRSNTMNSTSTTTDTIGTTQSSTTRRVIPITPRRVTPANTNATGVNCVDRSGRNFGTGDAGYTGCVNSMRTR